MRTTKICLIFVFMLTGCRQTQLQQPKPDIINRLEITSESEEGYYDIVFLISQHQKLPDGSQVISASGTYKGTSCGLDIVLGPSWKQGSIDLGESSSLATYQGNVTFRSIGAGSDSLLQIMDQLYGTKQSPTSMKNETGFTAISLQGNPQELKNGMTKIKLFYEAKKEDDYAELFTNIDLVAKKVYIAEKDVDYRSAVIRALKSPE